MNADIVAARARAAEAAVALVEPRMVVGLGSGRTAELAIRALAERVRAGLDISGVPTSQASADLATRLGIPLRQPFDGGAIDLTIDGADEIDDQLRLLKGAGGALTREKLVARASTLLVVVADHEKRVTRLGEKHRLPVELLAFGAAWTEAALRRLGLAPERRPTPTDNGGVLVDCTLPPDAELSALAASLKAHSGVIEHGLFLEEAHRAYVGTPTGLDVLEPPRRRVTPYREDRQNA